MRGDHHLFAVTTTRDEVTGDLKPLFSFPIQVAKATDDKEVKFDLAGPSGAERKQQYIDSATGDVIGADDTQHGVRVGDQFRQISDEDIAAIDAATKIDTMVALETIPYTDIPFDRITGHYYIQSPAKGGSPTAYRLVVEGLKEIKKGDKIIRPAKAIVTKRTSRSRQHLGVIFVETNDDGKDFLAMYQLRFATALRAPDEQILAPTLATVTDKQIEMVRQVIDNLTSGTNVLDTEVDDAQALKAQLIEQALAGEALDIPTPVAATNQAESLEALLEASLA